MCRQSAQGQRQGLRADDAGEHGAKSASPSVWPQKAGFSTSQVSERDLLRPRQVAVHRRRSLSPSFLQDAVRGARAQNLRSQRKVVQSHLHIKPGVGSWPLLSGLNALNSFATSVWMDGFAISTPRALPCCVWDIHRPGIIVCMIASQSMALPTLGFLLAGLICMAAWHYWDFI